jgi:4,5-DOPA dioxygenase extradiol
MPSMRETFHSDSPAAAYFDLLQTVLPQAKEQQQWQPADGRLPALFVSHGAPPTLDDPEWLGDLYRWAQSMPKPRGIVVVSAHWEAAPAALSATAAGTPLYYDFYGFHPRYYSLTYDTPDASDLAARVAGKLGYQPVHQFADRGLDHGAFIPLMAMYPAGDVPVVQVSMPSQEPSALLALGNKLRELRSEGILVIGSGFMTHSFAVMSDPRLASYTAEFDAWAADALARGDVDSLLDYRSKAPGVEVAHPTADHFVPLLLALGAADDLGSVQAGVQRMTWGNSIRSIQVD